VTQRVYTYIYSTDIYKMSHC